MLSPFKMLAPGKDLLRLKLKAERRIAAASRPDAARHAARLFLAHVPVAASARVAIYHPITDELDTLPLLAALEDIGAAIALPVTPKGRGALVFRAFRSGDVLEEGRYGTLVPAAGAEAVEPDVIVAPLLGFTRDGARLGYGGGYYDRTLADLRARRPVIAVGYGFGAQEVDALPVGPHDQRLDWIVTERDAIKVKAPAS